jgi:hypothetical protein
MLYPVAGLIIFLCVVGVLFFVSRAFTRALSSWLYRATGSEFTTHTIIALVLLPGVFIHEIAHWVVANVLFVRTGEIEFMPKRQEDGIKLGSVAIEETDFVRRFLIGVAPVLVGLAVLYGCSLYFSPYILTFSWQFACYLYVLFIVGNTMFSSGKDMEGSLAFFASVIALSLVAWILGAGGLVIEMLEQLAILFSLTPLLVMIIGIDLVLIALSNFLAGYTRRPSRLR